MTNNTDRIFLVLLNGKEQKNEKCIEKKASQKEEKYKVAQERKHSYCIILSQEQVVFTYCCVGREYCFNFFKCDISTSWEGKSYKVRLYHNRKSVDEVKNCFVKK